jgi:hypothetical protein
MGPQHRGLGPLLVPASGGGCSAPRTLSLPTLLLLPLLLLAPGRRSGPEVAVVLVVLLLVVAGV